MTTTLPHRPDILHSAPRALEILGMPPLDKHPNGYDIALPKLVDLSRHEIPDTTQNRGKLARQAFKSLHHLYTDTAVPYELKKHYGRRAERRLLRTALPELATRAVANGANQFVTQWYLPSAPQAGPAKFAIWDNSPGFDNADEFRLAYLKDSNFQYCGGTRDLRQVDDPHAISWPTTAIDTVARLGGTTTLATGNLRLRVAPSPDPRHDVTVQRAYLPLSRSIPGAAAIIELPLT